MAKVSATTAPPTPASSTPATSKDVSGRPQRVRHRSADALYKAWTLSSFQEVSCLDGRVIKGMTGDVVVAYDNGVTVDVLSPTEFERQYIPVAEASGIHLSEESLVRLGKVLRLGATHSEAELVQSVESLASVAIGEVKVQWSPGQIAELKRRADRRNLPYATYVRRIVDHILQEFWTAKTE